MFPVCIGPQILKESTTQYSKIDVAPFVSTDFNKKDLLKYTYNYHCTIDIEINMRNVFDK